MDKIEPYDYLKDSIISEEDIARMMEINPYKRYIRVFFKTIEVSEHRHFNKIYYLGYRQGVFSKLAQMGRLLREKGISKEEVRQMINTVLGQEILKPENNG